MPREIAQYSSVTYMFSIEDRDIVVFQWSVSISGILMASGWLVYCCGSGEI
jgi:hypothetical protein